MAQQFMIRSVSTLDCHLGTFVRMTREAATLREVLDTVQGLNKSYEELKAEGLEVQLIKTGFGPRDAAGRCTSFRWAWQSREDGKAFRTGDALFVSAQWEV